MDLLRIITCKTRFHSVIMLNAILDNIPIFYLSFFKAPKAIILEIVNWVSWTNVCKSKKQGGLEVKDCENFNLTLLSK